MRDGVDLQLPDQFRHGLVAHDPARTGREHRAAAMGQLPPRLVEHAERAVRQRRKSLAAFVGRASSTSHPAINMAA